MKNICILVIFLISFPGFSQINFESGYYINNSGAKINCKIRNSDWKNNPVAFDYKMPTDEKIFKTDIRQVSEFNIENSYKYRRFTVKIDRSGNDINNLSTDRNPIFETETLFLKSLAEGEANLYVYEDGNLVRYFISTGDHKTAEQLVYKEFITEGYAGENNHFRQQLQALLLSDKMNTADFEKLPYQKKPLVALFLKYNESDPKHTINYEKKQNQGDFNLKPLIGLVSNHLSIGDNFKKDYVFDKKTSFCAGLEAEYVMPFNRNKWSFFVAPNYQNYKSESTVSKVALKADYRYLSVPVGVRHYMFLTNSSKIFINAGFALSFDLDSEISINGYKPEVTKNSNFFVGAGFGYKKFAIEIRHDLNHGILAMNNLKSSFSTTGMVLSYRVF